MDKIPRRKGGAGMTYILAYSNSKGKVTMLTLYSEADLDKWIERLDRRIEKGTCGGYQITVVH